MPEEARGEPGICICVVDTERLLAAGEKSYTYGLGLD